MQCSYNSVVQGSVYYGDWDMWWTDDTQAMKNSVIKSMSGGPIYVSDTLDRSVKDVIMPTVYRDGRIIRLQNPAQPSPDCLFLDARESGKAFKLFNTHNENGILAVFNIDKDEKEVTATVSTKDMRIDETKEYCVYDWFSKKAYKLNGIDSFDLKLKNYDDFKLYLFVPIIDGKAIIGLADKYMSVATFEKLPNGEIKAFEEGKIGVMDYYKMQNVVADTKMRNSLAGSNGDNKK